MLTRFSNLLKASTRSCSFARSNMILSPSLTPMQLSQSCVFAYTPREVQLRNEKSGYYANPEDVARRLLRLISLHDKVANPSAITLSSTWKEIGVCPLTYVEIMLEAENEFYIELADEDLERFVTVNDAVEHISRSFFTN